MKQAKATKLGDNWIVKITDTRTLHCESDVRKFLRQQGLVIKPQFYTFKLDEQGKEIEEIIGIYAD